MSKANDIITILNMEFEDGNDLEHFVARIQENRDIIARALWLKEALEDLPVETAREVLCACRTQHMNNAFRTARTCRACSLTTPHASVNSLLAGRRPTSGKK